MKTLLCIFLVGNLCANSSGDKLEGNSKLPSNFTSGTIEPLKTAETFPFEIVNGMIIVQALVNTQQDNFILDTGSPEVILNSKESKGQKKIACGINGETTARFTTVKKFRFANAEKKKMFALMMDIEHLEALLGLKIKGIIGYDFLKDFELFLDYEAQFGQLRKAGGNRINETPEMIIPIQMTGHLGTIKTKICGRTFYLGLDTGASVNVLDVSRLKKLKMSNLSNSHRTCLAGLSTQTERITSVNIDQTFIKKEAFPNMRFAFADMKIFNDLEDQYLDGLLGYPFLKNLKISINFRKKKILIWGFNPVEQMVLRN